jgi:dolichol-phosphate mannosyltransferase
VNIAHPLPSLSSHVGMVTTSQPRVGLSQKLAIIIPTLHEAENIQQLLERIRCSIDPLGVTYESVVVDDDSGDGIEALVQQLSREDPRIRLLVRKNVRGLAGAVVHGWASTDAEILGVMDADLQHPPELLPQLWQTLQSGVDAVVASRYALPNSWGSWNRLRSVISRLAIFLAWPLQNRSMRVLDPMSGFFLIRRSCIEAVEFQTEGFKILLEVLVRAKLRSVVEVPFIFGKRRTGKSKASLRVAIDFLKLLAKLWKAHLTGPKRTSC